MQPQLQIGVELETFLDKDHELYRLANILNWEYLIDSCGAYYVENNGRPGVPIRVIAGLHYLKYLENESDESVVEKFCENPYWQYFCGFRTFQHELPCHPTTLVKWRQRVGEAGVEKLLSEKTKLVSCVYASNSLGTINPIQTIIQMAKNVGATVLIDGAQAIQHIPVNMQELNCDLG